MLGAQQTACFLPLVLVCSFAAVPLLSAERYRVPGTRSGFVTTKDRVRIHYLEAGPQAQAGENPAILFVPGWTMPAEIWEPQIAYFAKTHRVVAMDPRSQGESTKTPEGNASDERARDIRAVVQQLNLTPVILVGWSMGVMDLAAYVDQFGCVGVSGLVLVDGHAGYDRDPSELKEFQERVQDLVKDRPKATAEFVRSMYNKPQSEGYLQRITRAALETPTNTTLALLLALSTADYRPALAKIQRPTLIVGVHRPDTNVFEEMHQRIGGSKLELLDGVGHALFVDDPDRFNKLLAQFLMKL